MDFLRFFLPSALLSFGAYLQSRDPNKTGTDDTVGQILTAIAPAIGIALEKPGPGQTKALRRIMIALRDTATTWLDANPE